MKKIFRNAFLLLALGSLVTPSNMVFAADPITMCQPDGGCNGCPDGGCGGGDEGGDDDGGGCGGEGENDGGCGLMSGCPDGGCGGEGEGGEGDGDGDGGCEGGSCPLPE